MPEYMTSGSAGADIYAPGPVTIRGGEVVAVPTGMRLRVPDGYEAQVRPRSGLALRHGIVAVLGTIDSDYRGPIQVVLHNVRTVPYTVCAGDRIAQLVFAPVTRADFHISEEMLSDKTARGSNGFGSTGR